eukprot:135918_1
MNLVLNTSNRPSIEKLVIDGILEIGSVNQYYYTLDVHTINNIIRDSHGLRYNPHLIEVLLQYPDDTVHFNADDFELIYKEQRCSQLLSTVLEGVKNARIIVTAQEKEVLGHMEATIGFMKTSLEASPSQAEVDALNEFVQTQMASLKENVNAIQARLGILCGVDDDMIYLSHTSYSKHCSLYSRIATIDADIKQLRDHKNQPRVEDAIDALMTYKTNVEHDIRNVSTQTMLLTHDLNRRICISKAVGTQYANQFRLTFEYSLFVVNLLYLQYVDTLS